MRKNWKGQNTVLLYSILPFETILLVAIDKDNTQTGLIALLGDICKETKKILEVSVTIGVGESCSSLTDLSRPCYTALNALGYRAITGSGGVICIGDMEPSGHENSGSTAGWSRSL